MKTIILIITIITLMSFSLKSQILNDTNVIFIDYIPDSVLQCNFNLQDSLRIDINQDGVLDFKFYYVTNSGGCYPYIGSLNSNCRYYYFNDTITDSLNNPTIGWLSGNNFWSPYANTGVLFGIKIISGSDNYYGWIRAIGGSFGGLPVIVDKYAFCKIPNYPFHLGQTILTGITSNIYTPDSIIVYLANSGNTVIIQSGKIIKGVTLTSTTGVVVASQNNLNSNSANINVAGIAHGTFILQIQFKDLSIYTKQIIIL